MTHSIKLRLLFCLSLPLPPRPFHPAQLHHIPWLGPLEQFKHVAGIRAASVAQWKRGSYHIYQKEGGRECQILQSLPKNTFCSLYIGDLAEFRLGKELCSPATALTPAGKY